MHMDIHLANGKTIELTDVPDEDALALQEAWIDGSASGGRYQTGILSIAAGDGAFIDVWWYDVAAVVLS
jgi:hypothetical protein